MHSVTEGSSNVCGSDAQCGSGESLGLFHADNCNTVLHYYCANSTCMTYFGPGVPDVCATCGKCYNGLTDLCGNSYMLVLRLEQQLRESATDSVKSVNARKRKAEEHMETEPYQQKILRLPEDRNVVCHKYDSFVKRRKKPITEIGAILDNDAELRFVTVIIKAT